MKENKTGNKIAIWVIGIVIVVILGLWAILAAN